MMGKLTGAWIKQRTPRLMRAKLDEQLSAYLDGELSAVECARLEGLLAGNDELRADLEDLRKTVALMRELPPAVMPHGFLLLTGVAGRQSARVPPRPRLAWAPLLTAASAAVSLLFIVAIAGSLFSTAQVRPMAAPPVAVQAPEEPVVLAEEVAVEAEVMRSDCVTVEVEVEASPEPEAKAAAVPAEAPAHEAVPEPEAAAGGATREEEQPAAVLAAEAAEPESESEELLGIAAEAAEESDTPASGTQSAERASEAADAAAPDDAGREGAIPAPSPPPSDTEQDLAAEAAEAFAQDEAELPAAEDTASRETSTEGELASAPSEASPPEPIPVGSSLPTFPWRPLQIGLGSAAIILIVATAWAWRLRR